MSHPVKKPAARKLPRYNPAHPPQPDHTPLTQAEVESLLEKAAEPGISVHARAKLQVRLAQAIPGMVSPRPTTGPIAGKLLAVNSLFVKEVQGLRSPKQVQALARQLMPYFN